MDKNEFAKNMTNHWNQRKAKICNPTFLSNVYNDIHRSQSKRSVLPIYRLFISCITESFDQVVNTPAGDYHGYMLSEILPNYFSDI